MAAYMWNGLQPVTSFTLIPNPNPNPNSLLGVLGYDYHNKAGPGGETTHLGLFSTLRHPSPHPNPHPNLVSLVSLRMQI